jgi:hypothetical protein
MLIASVSVNDQGVRFEAGPVIENAALVAVVGPETHGTVPAKGAVGLPGATLPDRTAEGVAGLGHPVEDGGMESLSDLSMGL